MQRVWILLLCICISGRVSAEKSITVCSDSNFWYPFTFVKDGRSAGLHIDIITKALNNLGHHIEFKPLPWKRCLADAKQGIVDGVATASYDDKRTGFLYYPADAPSVLKSDHRVMQVEYVVVTSADNHYVFDGDVTTLPQPVRTPRGYSIADDLRKQGVEVDDRAVGDENNIKKLLRHDKGSVIMIPEMLDVFNEQDVYQGRLKVSALPLKSKSYYLAMSKGTALSAEMREAIWDEIARVREDAAFMLEVTAKY